MRSLFNDSVGKEVLYKKGAYAICSVSLEDTKDYILNIHYAHRMPSVTYRFGLYESDFLVGVITYGTPASHQLCIGVAGDDNARNVIELNRLVLLNNKKNEASFLIGNTLKLLPSGLFVVSYADTDQKHEGIVYQASNFMFTGTTKERTDMAGKEGKHSRHHLGDKNNRVRRSPKHRYIFITGSARLKRKLKKQLRYKGIK